MKEIEQMLSVLNQKKANNAGSVLAFFHCQSRLILMPERTEAGLGVESDNIDEGCQRTRRERQGQPRESLETSDWRRCRSVRQP